MNLKDLSENERAYEKAVRLLAVRARSASEIRQRLSLKRFSPLAIDSAMEKLTRQGYLNDAQFAKEWVRMRLQQGKGRRLIQGELFKKGISRELQEKIVPQQDDTATLETAATRRLARYRNLDPLKTRQRLWMWLAARGFERDKIEEVLQRILKEN